jgi:prophage antirepressor-like protein
VLFKNKEGFKVRATIIDGEPWFVAKDICDVLGLGNPSKAIQTLDDDEKGVLTRANDPNQQLGSFGGSWTERRKSHCNVFRKGI